MVQPTSPTVAWLKELGEASLCIVLPFLYIWVAIMMSGKMPGKVGSDMKLHPLAN